MSALYLIGLGSNQRHAQLGLPRAVIDAAFAAVDAEDALSLIAMSSTISSPPMGPSQRFYANAAGLIRTGMSPPELLARLQLLEARFGRCRRGQRWRSRVLDLDILLWDEGVWVAPDLAIPHRGLCERDFVLRPACQIAGHWRHPLNGLSLRHHLSRLEKD